MFRQRKIKIVARAIIIAALAWAVYALFSPLALFTRRISHADRAVVAIVPLTPSVSITITGEDLQHLKKIVSSGHRDRQPYDCSAIAKVTFFRHAEILGQMTTCSQLMWINGRQYRDDTLTLDNLLVNPILDAYHHSEIPQTETK